MRDPYRILGVPTTASLSDIKKAFRDLARVHHPDVDPNNPWAEDDFKEIAAAYDVLASEDRRAAYDRKAKTSGKAAPRTAKASKPKPEAKRAGDAPNSGSRREPKIDGIDITYDLSVPFMEAANGCKQTIDTTNGKTLNVSVPAGSRDGTTLRFKAQGMRGFGGGKDGDALITLHVEPDPMYRVESNTVVIDANVTLQEAVLGGKIDVPTIYGTVQVTVPEGSNTGTRLRLRGKGLAIPNSTERGDQIVDLTVVLPKKPDPELTKFVKKWGAKTSYTVR